MSYEVRQSRQEPRIGMGEITKADSPPSKSVHYLGSVHPNAKAKSTHVSISVMTDERTWLRESSQYKIRNLIRSFARRWRHWHTKAVNSKMRMIMMGTPGPHVRSKISSDQKTPPDSNRSRNLRQFRLVRDQLRTLGEIICQCRTRSGPFVTTQLIMSYR